MSQNNCSVFTAKTPLNCSHTLQKWMLVYLVFLIVLLKHISVIIEIETYFIPWWQCELGLWWILHYCSGFSWDFLKVVKNEVKSPSVTWNSLPLSRSIFLQLSLNVHYHIEPRFCFPKMLTTLPELFKNKYSSIRT